MSGAYLPPHITLADFKKKTVHGDIYYLTARFGDWEITIEPHLAIGYSVGIYHNTDPLISVKKRSVWRKNHPDGRAPERIVDQTLATAVGFAEEFYQEYIINPKYAGINW